MLFREEIEHAIDMFGCKSIPSMEVCSVIRDFRQVYQALPTLDQLVVYHYEPCSTLCEHSMPVEDVIPIQMYAVMEYGIFFRCSVTYAFHVFQFLNNRYPRLDEVDTENSPNASSQWTESIHQQVDEFWNKTTSGLDLSKLESCVLESNHSEACSICQDTMSIGQPVITLPCNHTFHSASETCSGIQEWLKRVNTCPLCKTSIFM